MNYVDKEGAVWSEQPRWSLRDILGRILEYSGGGGVMIESCLVRDPLGRQTVESSTDEEKTDG